jgi:ABC-type transporter Mla subunit MlaD
VKQNTDERRVRRGYAILAGLLLAAVVVFNLDALVDRVRGYLDVVALVSETSGVRVGSPVWIAGIEAGRVTDVSFAGHGDSALIALDLRLEARVRPLLRRGSTAHTAKQRFIGRPLVRIEAGPGSAPLLEHGDTIGAAEQVDIQALLARGKEFPETLDSLRITLEEVRAIVEVHRPRLLLLAERLATTAEAAGSLGTDLQQGSLGRLLADPQLGQRIQALDQHLARLTEAGQSLGRYAEGDLGRRVPDLLDRAAALGDDLGRLQAALETPRGTLPRLQQDSALAVAIRGVTAQIDSLRAEGLSFGLRMLIP